MTTYVPAKKGAEYIFFIGLVSQSTGQFQSNPTLAAGDFKISKDGGALSNLATLPAVTPASSKAVKVTLSTTEMDADNIVVIGSDAAGAEWDDVFVNIQTAARQIDDLATQASVNTIDDFLDTEIAAIQADTDNIQTRLPAALSGDGFIKADLKSIEDELTNGYNATLKLKQVDIESNGTVTPLKLISGVNGNPVIHIEASGVDSNAVLVTSDGDAFSIGSVTGAALGLYSDTGKSINAPQDIALPSGDLDDQLQAIDNYIDTEVAAIKAKTDQLTFTTANQVDANIQSVNDTALTGDGSTTPWGPA